MKKTVGAVLICAAFTGALSAGAEARDKDRKVQTPESFRKLTACREIADATARLACYDREVATIASAEQAGDIVVADRAEVTEARKGLFGFSFPQIKLFRDRDGDAPIEQIESTIKSAQVANRSGQWQITLEDGAVWMQIDTEALAITPKAGHKVVIKRAAMGSFRARINNQPPIRVRRVQ